MAGLNDLMSADFIRMEEFFKRLDDCMHRRAMQRKELAIETGINYSTLQSYWSKHRIPKAEDLVSIARVLGTTSEYLITGENPPLDTNIPPETAEAVAILNKLSDGERREALGYFRTYAVLFLPHAGRSYSYHAAEKPAGGNT